MPLSTGKLHFGWKGESAVYTTKHQWVIRWFGQPNECENCGRTEIPEGMKRYFDWANVSGEYKRIRSDWKRLCKLCHAKFDLHLKPKGAGHSSAKFTDEQVAEIRKMKKENPALVNAEIARQHGVSKTTINSILNHRTYGRID